MTLKARLTRLETALEPQSLAEFEAMNWEQQEAWLKLLDKRAGDTHWADHIAALEAKMKGMSNEELLKVRAESLERSKEHATGHAGL